MNAKQIAGKIRKLIADGTTLRVDYQPGVISEHFDAKSHEFHLASIILRHECDVRIVSNAYYRQASTAHDWQPDVYSFIPRKKEEKEMHLKGHEGRNGAPKRKNSQWRSSHA